MTHFKVKTHASCPKVYPYYLMYQKLYVYENTALLEGETINTKIITSTHTIVESRSVYLRNQSKREHVLMLAAEQKGQAISWHGGTA